MNRKVAGWRFPLIYLALVVIVAIFIWPQSGTITLSLPVGDAILLAGAAVCGLVVASIEIGNLWKVRQRLTAIYTNSMALFMSNKSFDAPSIMN